MAKYKYIDRFSVTTRDGRGITYALLNINNLLKNYRIYDENYDKAFVRENGLTKTNYEERREWRNEQLNEIKSEIIGLIRCLGFYDIGILKEKIDENVINKSSKIERTCLKMYQTIR